MSELSSDIFVFNVVLEEVVIIVGEVGGFVIIGCLIFCGVFEVE